MRRRNPLLRLTLLQSIVGNGNRQLCGEDIRFNTRGHRQTTADKKGISSVPIKSATMAQGRIVGTAHFQISDDQSPACPAAIGRDLRWQGHVIGLVGSTENRETAWMRRAIGAGTALGFNPVNIRDRRPIGINADFSCPPLRDRNRAEG